MPDLATGRKCQPAHSAGVSIRSAPQNSMGCIASKGRAAPEPAQNSLSLPISLLDLLPSSGPLTRAQIRNRILSTDGEQTVVLEKAGLVVRYAFVSLRGCAAGALYPWSLSPFSDVHVSPHELVADTLCWAGTTQKPWTKRTRLVDSVRFAS